MKQQIKQIVNNMLNTNFVPKTNRYEVCS